MQLAVRIPDFIDEAERAVRGEYTDNTIRVMREAYFSPDVSPEEFAHIFSVFHPMVQEESMRALTEMMALALRMPVKRPRIPALVIGGEHDAMFAANRLYMTASGWNAETSVIPRSGHMLMLDPQWESVAQKIDAWIGAKVMTRVAA